MSRVISQFLVVIYVLLPLMVFANDNNAASMLEDVSSKKQQVIANYTYFDMKLGNDDAPIKIVDYSSFTCPHCANFYLNVLPELYEQYKDTNTIQIIHRDFPFDKAAFKASILAHCSSNIDKFSIIKLIYQRQNDWAWPGKIEQGLVQIANLIGLGAAEYENCLYNKDLESRLLGHNLTIVKDLELSATPTIYINGRHYRGGHSVDRVAEIVELLMAEQLSKESQS